MGVRGGGVSSMMAGGYRFRRRITEGVKDPLLDNRAGGGDDNDISGDVDIVV